MTAWLTEVEFRDLLDRMDQRWIRYLTGPLIDYFCGDHLNRKFRLFNRVEELGGVPSWHRSSTQKEPDTPIDNREAMHTLAFIRYGEYIDPNVNLWCDCDSCITLELLVPREFERFW